MMAAMGMVKTQAQTIRPATPHLKEDQNYCFLFYWLPTTDYCLLLFRHVPLTRQEK